MNDTEKLVQQSQELLKQGNIKESEDLLIELRRKGDSPEKISNCKLLIEFSIDFIPIEEFEF